MPYYDEGESTSSFNEMLLAGCKLTAVEARDCGLVTDVFSHENFTEEVQNRIQAMAKLAKQL